jgi:hypothetical protein
MNEPYVRLLRKTYRKVGLKTKPAIFIEIMLTEPSSLVDSLGSLMQNFDAKVPPSLKMIKLC